LTYIIYTLPVYHITGKLLLPKSALCQKQVLSSKWTTSGVPFPVTQAKGKEHISKPKLTHLLLGLVQDIPLLDAIIGNG
jgi:hypothetical protein